MDYNAQVLEFLDARKGVDDAELASALDAVVPCSPLMRQFSPVERIAIARQYRYRKALTDQAGEDYGWIDDIERLPRRRWADLSPVH